MQDLIPHSVHDWFLLTNPPVETRQLDVVLITHPRDTSDLERVFPFLENLSENQKYELTKCLKPIFGEIIVAPNFTVGLLFLPFYAEEIIDPRRMAICRKLLQEGVNTAVNFGAKTICLGGLTATLSKYGRKVEVSGNSQITTGHCMTCTSVYLTLVQSIQQLSVNTMDKTIVILGIGSIGKTVTKLLLHLNEFVFDKIYLVDRKNRSEDLYQLKLELEQQYGIEINIETTDSNGSLSDESIVYHSDIVISAVSTAYVVDIDKLSPYTILVDDSQPYCWHRSKAWERCITRMDIVPCEAGLIDCSSVGFTSRFPFDFADYDDGVGSSIAWSCLSEGIAKSLIEELPSTIGEPSFENLLKYYEAFKTLNFQTPPLQCGENALPIEELKYNFTSNSITTYGNEPLYVLSNAY